MADVADYENAFRDGPVGLIAWRRAEGWAVVSASPNLGEIIGYGAEELRAGDVEYADIVHEQDSPGLFERIGIAAAGDATDLVLDYRIVTRDGETRRIFDHTRIERDESGEAEGFVSHLFDATALARDDGVGSLRQGGGGAGDPRRGRGSGMSGHERLLRGRRDRESRASRMPCDARVGVEGERSRSSSGEMRRCDRARQGRIRRRWGACGMRGKDPVPVLSRLRRRVRAMRHQDMGRTRRREKGIWPDTEKRPAPEAGAGRRGERKVRVCRPGHRAV